MPTSKRKPPVTLETIAPEQLIDIVDLLDDAQELALEVGDDELADALYNQMEDLDRQYPFLREG